MVFPSAPIVSPLKSDPSQSQMVRAGLACRLTRVTSQRMPRDQRRAQLLSAAREVFVSQGYHSAAMDEIADRAGVSKPVLYQHFPGKLDLYVALLDDSSDVVIDAVRAALASTHDNKQRVAATMRAFYSYVANAEGAFRLVFESDLTNEPLVKERLDRVRGLDRRSDRRRHPTPFHPVTPLGSVLGGDGSGKCQVLAEQPRRHRAGRSGGLGRGPCLARYRRLPPSR